MSTDQALLDLLAGHNDVTPEPHHPAAHEFVREAVERGIVLDVVQGSDIVRHLWARGEIESFDVAGFGPFLCLKGRRPDLEGLPKAGDEIVCELVHPDREVSR